VVTLGCLVRLTSDEVDRDALTRPTQPCCRRSILGQVPRMAECRASPGGAARTSPRHSMKPSKVSANARAELRAGRSPPSKAAWTVNAADRADRRGFSGSSQRHFEASATELTRRGDDVENPLRPSFQGLWYRLRRLPSRWRGARGIAGDLDGLLAAGSAGCCRWATPGAPRSTGKQGEYRCPRRHRPKPIRVGNAVGRAGSITTWHCR